jgi:hypothetical protein
MAEDSSRRRQALDGRTLPVSPMTLWGQVTVTDNGALHDDRHHTTASVTRQLSRLLFIAPDIWR